MCIFINQKYIGVLLLIDKLVLSEHTNSFIHKFNIIIIYAILPALSSMLAPQSCFALLYGHWPLEMTSSPLCWVCVRHQQEANPGLSSELSYCQPGHHLWKRSLFSHSAQQGLSARSEIFWIWERERRRKRHKKKWIKKDKKRYAEDLKFLFTLAAVFYSAYVEFYYYMEQRWKCAVSQYAHKPSIIRDRWYESQSMEKSYSFDKMSWTDKSILTA